MTIPADFHSAALQAGAAVTDLTPPRSVFLYGYPHVTRDSTGVNDPLRCAALFLRGGGGQILFLANDLIHVSKRFTAFVRRAITVETGVPEHAIMITATHTHSGPVMVDHLSNAADATVPKADADYLAWVAQQMVAAAQAAVKTARPAELGLAVARANGVGTNRHDPAGPADPEVPVLVVRACEGGAPIAAMIVYAMHPTVLHEDSTLISGDFPHYARWFLQKRVLGAACPVLYHNGASGNQSPRHVTRANTFAEAQRLGELLGQAVAAALLSITFSRACPIVVRRTTVELTLRQMPASDGARRALAETRARFEKLKHEGAPRTAVRTAECDVFGAEETAELALAATDGRLETAARECSPAEIQVVEIGPWKFVGWPGEFFVEYALELKRRAPDTFVITLANGELQAYIVTAEADARGVYEARNALFSYENGPRIVEATLALLGRAH
ncbi:MAG: neutral/alkaline non-lysosomal ceramidase N-terminal domain-containing protein [Opitutaceae bacterium]